MDDNLIVDTVISIDKQKYLYYHCLTSCEHKETIMNELRNVEITI